MNITLNEQLKKLRRGKGNTQEELAVFLGITVQAVSKWERGEGYPDITFLPAIAEYYNVSVDELLGVNEALKQKKIDEYLAQEGVLFNQGKTSERIALWREAKKEFPNNYQVMYFLMCALGAESRTQNADEIIELGERILDECTDNQYRDGAIQTLCFTYHYGKKDTKNAQKYASMASDCNVTKQALLAHILEGDKQIRICQGNIEWMADEILLNVNLMINKGNFNDEEKIKLLNFPMAVFNALYEDGNFGFYHARIKNIHLELAHCCLNLGKEDEFLSHLEAAAEHAIKYDTRQSGYFTSFIVNHCYDNVEGSSKNYTENDSAILLNELKKSRYDRFEDYVQMKTIKEKLEKYAQY
jgi:transcriptional regulator with XRE-family HTH domain